MQKKVFIPNLPTRWDASTDSRVPSLDLNTASRFGSLVTITESPIDTKTAIDMIRFMVDKIDAEDYILCVGDVVLTAVAISYVCARNGVANVLRWDRKRKSYDLERIEL